MKKQSDKTKVKLSKVVISNFKSFKSRHEIGYFQNFSSLIGSNGSGKSNVTDAICFCFGFSTSALRCKNIKELVNKYKIKEVESRKDQSYVEMHFSYNNDPSIVNENNNFIVLRRQINSDTNGTEYFINDSKKKSDDYLNFLKDEMKINIKSNFFMVAQGSIDNFMSNKYLLTEIIESLSGSIEYKEEYDSLKTEMDSIKSNLLLTTKSVGDLKEKTKEVKTLIQTEERLNQVDTELEDLLERIFLYRILEQDEIINYQHNNLKLFDVTYEEVTQEKEKVLLKLSDLNEKLRKGEENHEERELLLKMELEMNGIKEEIEGKESEMNLLQSKIIDNTSKLHSLKNEKEKLNIKKEKYLKEKEEENKKMNELTKRINKRLPMEKLSNNQIEEYNRLISTFTINNSSKLLIQTDLSKEIQKVNYELSQLIEEEQIKKGELMKCEENLKQINLFLLNSKIKLDDHISKINEIEIKKNELIQMKEKITKENALIEERIYEIDVKIRNNEINNQELDKRRRVEKIIKQDQGIFGFLNELIYPCNQKYELAIKICLSGYLNHLVVDSFMKAKEISKVFKQNDISIDILILENIYNMDFSSFKPISNYGKYGEYLSSFINFRKEEIKPAVEFLLKGILFCYEYDNVIYLKKLGASKVILQDGTMFRKGMITSGVNKYIGSSGFIKEDIKKLKEEMNEEEGKYENNSEKIIKINENIASFDKKIEDLSISKTLLIELIAKENKKEEQFNKEHQVLNDNISSISKGITDISNKKTEIFNKFERITKELSNEKGNIYGSFFKKCGINEFDNISIIELESFENEKFTIQARINKIDFELLSLENINESIHKTDEIISDIKQKRDDLNKAKQSLKENLNELTLKHKDLSYKSLSSSDVIQKLKKEINLIEEEYEKVDYRLRLVYKNKIESGYIIKSANKMKNQIIDDFKNNLSSYLIKYKTSLALNFIVNTDKYIIGINHNEDNDKEYTIEYVSIDISKSLSNEIKQLEITFQEKLIEKEQIINIILKTNNSIDELHDKKKELNENKKEIDREIRDLFQKKDMVMKRIFEISQIRKNKFEDFMNILSDEVNKIYKKVSINNNHSLGGSASLYNLDSHEPFNSQTRFLPIPPGKSYILDFDSLSGGEKTVAIIALVFALQKITLSPLIILDEIDAYLDPTHDAILESLILKHIEDMDNKIQVVIVSHKIALFKSSESLIGIYYNQRSMSSIPISLNLKEYA